VNLVFDQTNYPLKGGIPTEVAKNLRVDWQTHRYQPIVYMSDFWHLKKDFMPLNETLWGERLNLTLNFQPYPVYYF